MPNVAKAVAYNQKQRDSKAFTDEMVVTLVAAWQDAHGLAADGACGPTTQSSLRLAAQDGVAPAPLPPPPPRPPVALPLPPAPAPLAWTPFDGPLDKQPTNRTEVYKIFGNPGTVEPDKKWVKANIVEVQGKSAMPGVPPKWYFKCHKLVEPYMREAFRRAKLACPEYQIEKAASFVFRHMRHDPDMPLSYHSWGIAVDVDPDLNFSKTFAAGKTPEPWSAEWNKIWPNGLPKAFVEAFESCGFRWGGRWKGWVDPMHLEFLGKSSV